MNILILFQVALGQTVSHRYRLDHPEIVVMCVNNIIHVLVIYSEINYCKTGNFRAQEKFEIFAKKREICDILLS